MTTEVIEKIEGIGPHYGDILQQHGITTLEDLRQIDVSAISSSTGISTMKLRSWKAMNALAGLQP